MCRTGKGFTLLEVLISTTLFSIVFAGVYLLYATMQGMMSRGELMSDLQQNARVGLDKMVQEIRMAGYDPQGAIPLVALAQKARSAPPAARAFHLLDTLSFTARTLQQRRASRSHTAYREPRCIAKRIPGTGHLHSQRELRSHRQWW